jgi:hypothetical protein
MSPLPQLSPDAFARAAAFMNSARLLERTLFTHHFEQGAAAPAVEALQEFQNTDGGFWGLEPDIGFSASTVLSTCIALHILHDLRAPTAHPLVQQALDYLVATYDESRDVWPIIPPHDNSQPHAPWWHHSEKSTESWRGLVDNPRPDVLACLQLFSCEKTDALRQRLNHATLAHLRAATAEIEMHGLTCYLQLHRASGLSGELKQELDRLLPAWIDHGVERDPAKWSGYGLRPLDVAPTADSPWRVRLGSCLDQNLDFLIQNQAADGSWHPYWNWGDNFPEAWPAAKRQWQAFLTLRALRSLDSYGRTDR